MAAAHSASLVNVGIHDYANKVSLSHGTDFGVLGWHQRLSGGVIETGRVDKRNRGRAEW